jgi:hypothetical protein
MCLVIGNILTEMSVHNLSAETRNLMELLKEPMNIVKTKAAALISSLLIGAASTPAWAATSATQAPINEVLLSKSVAGSLPATRSWFDPSPVDAASRQNATNCKAGNIYSQHDIVGDRQACIVNRLTIGGGVAP